MSISVTEDPITSLAIVDDLMAKAFAPGREPRSGSYKAGVRALLQSQGMFGQVVANPFPRGSAEADAFWAGVEEGKAIWELANTAPSGTTQ
jgi:hypothetical protein